MKTTQQLLQILADGEQYSGEALGRQLQISRAGVWKAMQQLTKLGIEIESVRGNGYRIPGGLELLNKASILAELDKHYVSLLDELTLLDQVDSTHTYLLQYSASNKRIACLAEHQTAGRARRGRHWLSPYGHNIYCSLLWRFNCDPAEIVGLSLAIAVATLRTLQSYGIYQQLGLKWPNDVFHNGKKLAGIMLDVMAESHNHSSVIISVGLNTHLPPAQAATLNQATTSIQNITHQPVRRNHLAGLLLKHIFIALDQFTEQKLSPFLDEWRQFDQLAGKAVSLQVSEQQIYGKMHGISTKGELILLDDQQQQHFFLSGDVSLRPRYA